MKCSAEDRAILDSWPVVTDGDIAKMNDQFPHYIFFRPGKDAMELWSSCCGRHETQPYLQRTETPADWALLDACQQNERHTCPWCGKAVTMKDLRKSGKRKGLESYRYVMLLHGRGNVLYGDALVLRKSYKTVAELTANPEYWPSSGYRFALGDVMQVDYQKFSDGWVTHERGRLGRRKLVQEPFKCGSISWYSHGSYAIIGRDVLGSLPAFRYCEYFGSWQYRPCGPRGYAGMFGDFVAYMTAYCIYPRQIELLVKAGLYQPVMALVWDRKKYAGAINWEEPDVRKAMGLTRRDLSQVIALQPPMEALELRNYANRHFGAKWDVEDALTFYQMWGIEIQPLDVLRFARKYHLTLDRLLRHLVVWAGDTGAALDTAFVLYRDYLGACYYLGRCLEHTAVLWPEDLQAAHDEATDQMAVMQLAELEKTERKGVAVSAKERKAKYEFELDGLKIVFPMTAAAIKREGKILDHCVGGYAERHMKDVLTILFLRRAETPNVPYVTIEMRGNQIQQIHGYQNDIAAGAKNPRTVHKQFLDTWLAWLKRGSPRNDDGTPKLPKPEPCCGLG